MRPQRFSCGIMSEFGYATYDDVLASMRPQRFSCGITRKPRAPLRYCCASMRPQRFSCGIRELTLDQQNAEARFNEAAAFQLRNLGRGVESLGRLTRASMRPQRFSCGIAHIEREMEPELAASMRPQRFSCGICSSHVRVRRSAVCFNEAAAFQLRNPR